MKKIMNFLMKDISLINIYLLIGIVFVVVFITSSFSYALFTYERTSSTLIKITYDPIRAWQIEGTLANRVVGANLEHVTTTCDGLYSYNNKFYFSGAPTNNYIMFNNEVWRIVSVEEDGSVKLIRNEPISKDQIVELENASHFWLNNTDENFMKKIISAGKIAYDFTGRRPLDKDLSNSYCQQESNGCNAYYKGKYANKIVDEDSLMKKYLETEILLSMDSLAQEQIKRYKYKTGVVETNKNINDVLIQEKANFVISNIGLLNISDYVYASLNTICKDSFDKETCAEQNWLYLEGIQYFLMNGKVTTTNAQVWTVSSTGKLTSQDANNQYYLRPVVVLQKNITATGTGEINNMYQLGEVLPASAL